MQLRIADKITAFARSMRFEYVHIVAFAAWRLLDETAPWSKLTLVVLLEAIFLSTFVMIGPNRQSEFQRARANDDYSTGAQELRLNTELTQAIRTVRSEIHQRVVDPPAPAMASIER